MSIMRTGSMDERKVIVLQVLLILVIVNIY